MKRLTLNQEQKSAVEYRGGPLLIIAGAGTGKTTVITERIKWLITERNILPSQILALTFTEKAAAEMEERVDLALPLGYSQLWIATFHSFCDQVLREEAIHIGLDPDFKLLTEAESILFFRRHLFHLKLNYFRPAGNPTKFLAALLNHFSRLRDEDITPSQYLEFAQKQQKKADTKEEKIEGEKTLELALAFSRYQELKEKEGVMDFADLISNLLRLFRQRPNILKNYQKKFRYLLIDEFQDTNIAQYELIKLLKPPTSKNPQLTVTGDDYQSIYKFRGAAVSNILTFIKDYPQAKTVVLTKNYRSSQLILDHAYRLIKFNDPDTLEAKLKIPKNLKSVKKKKGKPIKLIFTSRGEEEAEKVALEIEKLTEKKYQFKDIAILVRANNQAEPFSRALSRQQIPYQFLGPGQLFRQPEIKDLIAYLKILNDPADEVAAFRLSSMAVFLPSLRDLAFIRSFAKRNNLSLLEALEKISQKKRKELPFSISPESKKGAKKLISLLHRHLKLVRREGGGQILYYFLHDSGLLKKYLHPQNEREQLAALNVAKFFDKIKSFESQNKETSVTHLLDWITLRMEMGESPLAAETDWSEKDAVNILTVHSAKGLEFPVVFLVNLVNRRFPTSQRKIPLPLPQPLIKEILPEGDPYLQEERRLFYVAMTRAKERLFFTAAKFYHQGGQEKRLSPFIEEALGREKLKEILKKSTAVTEKQLTLLEWEKKEQIPSPPHLNPPVSYLSFSQVDSFSICPQQYKYKYILKIPTLPSPSQTMGNTIHKTLKIFYQKQLVRKKPFSLVELIALLEKNWSSEGFPSKSYEKESKEKAKQMLTDFYHHGFNFQKIGNVLALEQPFSFKITPTLTVGGVIDRVDNLEGKKIEIIDYKTGARTPNQKDVDRNDQLSLYALAASTLRDLPFYRPVEEITLSLYFLDAGIKISSQRTEEQLQKTREKIIKIAEGIEKTNFPPKPNRPFPCDYCEFKLLCDSWR